MNWLPDFPVVYGTLDFEDADTIEAAVEAAVIHYWDDDNEVRV